MFNSYAKLNDDRGSRDRNRNSRSPRTRHGFRPTLEGLEGRISLSGLGGPTGSTTYTNYPSPGTSPVPGQWSQP